MDGLSAVTGRSAPAHPGVSGAADAAVLRRLELSITRRLDGILHGDHRGLVPGHGSEPGEARVYEPGDDVRRIDWNVTARTNQPHLRESIADRELEAWIVADRSASTQFGTTEVEKADIALAAAAAVGFMTNRGGNRLGALVAGAGRARVVPARQGRSHLLAVLKGIQEAGRSAPDDDELHFLGDALRRLGGVAKRRGFVVVISDFLDDPETWRRPLAALGIRHEVLCIEVVDPRELELPAVGVLTLIDAESGRRREINTSSRNLRERYRLAAADQRRAIASAIRAAGADHLQLRTDRDWLVDLARHVTGRRHRSAYSGAGAARARVDAR